MSHGFGGRRRQSEVPLNRRLTSPIGAPRGGTRLTEFTTDLRNGVGQAFPPVSALNMHPCPTTAAAPLE